jgi:hypothetical protein
MACTSPQHLVRLCRVHGRAMSEDKEVVDPSKWGRGAWLIVDLVVGLVIVACIYIFD